jgi:O-antigen ligase
VALRLDWPRTVAVAGIAAAALVLGLAAGVNPQFAVAGSILSAYVLLTFADLSVGLAVFVTLSFFELLSVGGAAIGFTKVLGLVLALSWFAQVTTRRAHRTDFLAAHPAATYALALLIGWCAVSAVWAEAPRDALETAYQLLLNAVLYVIVYTAVRSTKTATMTVVAFILGAAAAATYGVIAGPDSTEGARLGSDIFDPNELAAALVPGIVLAIGLGAMPRRDQVGSVLAYAIAGVCLTALLFTASRGGLIALTIAMIVGIVMAGRWRPHAAILAVVVAISGVYYFNALAPDSARDRVAAATSGQVQHDEGRSTLWEVGWRMFEANSVTGVGGGNFSEASVRYLLQPGAISRSDKIIDEPAVAHNSYLEMLAELGIVGGGLFFAVILFSIASAARAAKAFERLGDRGMEVLSRALVAALAGTVAADFFISEQVSKQLWLLLALGPAMLGIARRASGERV